MRLVCAPLNGGFGAGAAADLEVVLFSHADRPTRAAAGANVVDIIRRAKLRPATRAWDLLSIALSVIAADTGVRRDESPDGWTREINLQIAVSDPTFWTAQKDLFEKQLRFLTTDLWTLSFTGGGVQPVPPNPPAMPPEDCVALLSGGLDSLIGAIDLVSGHGKRPYLVSQVAQGDKEKQAYFASKLGGGLKHLQLNHDANCPGVNERSQRARSIIFLAYAVLLATSLKRYHDGQAVTVYVCENGYISINPALTPGRLGSLSTRTTHPIFIGLFQSLLDVAGLRVRIENPYQFKTKGEMLAGCADQAFLKKNAHTTTSCGRFARNGFRHCGRCVPCLIRRASFHAWGEPDKTVYVYSKLSKNDSDHSGFDDVRSAAMAVAQVRSEGLDRWLGASLNSVLMGDTMPYKQVVARGLEELGKFLKATGVK
ncbi:Qat anti-phage system QueC-like protein QatC [Chelativorans sp. J32]|uniref:Qat anti-phage system QueC-like protein QatC n=1 Tax=Chelativorans sp. J32 TaxID=935840 RepID=UPI0004875DD7|nr:Qat anti-phage system QueC-like protein QatC [Chelativorans sp. J32]